MSTSSTSAGSFTGSSSFSSSLAQVISRAVSIASLPMENLQTEQTTLQNQQSELQTLSGDFTNLGSAITSLDLSTGLSSLSASLANTNMGTATLSTGAMTGTYTINVTGIGAQTNTYSNSSTPVTDPSTGNISADSSFQLSVNSTTYNFSASTLDDLVSAINSSGANVQATIMNIGSSSSPNYQLSVQSLNYAPDTIQLTDTANSQTLLTQLTPGAYVEYQVNGQPTQPIDSTTRNVVISPGLTVNLQATGSTTVTVAQNGSSVLNALSSLVSAYNTALDELGKQRGQNGGALTGEGIVYSLTMALQNLANYSAPGGNLQNMSDIGLEFDQTGHLTLDATTFNQAAATNMSDVLNFLGSASGQTGFIGAASSVLTGINDSTNGILPQETTTLGNELTTLGNQINDDQTNVNQLQSNLTAQMAAADASIATLEQQSSYLQMMFQTENANAQLGY